jgi:hypothetical protein
LGHKVVGENDQLIQVSSAIGKQRFALHEQLAKSLAAFLLPECRVVERKGSRREVKTQSPKYLEYLPPVRIVSEFANVAL